MPIDDYFKMQMRKKPIAIGNDIFTSMGRAYYVDKTLLVRDIIKSETRVILFTRPRRFGKTLNMTMLQTFFEKPLDGKDTSHYFKDLKIWQAGEEYRAEQGKRPVIFLSLKDMEYDNFQYAFNMIKAKIADEYTRHGELEDSTSLQKTERGLYTRIVNKKASKDEWDASLRYLCSMLEKHYGEKPLLLIDEYDVPLQNAWMADNSYYKEMTEFIKNLFSAAFKTNTSLYKGILTGVTRISKESIFSGLNNIKVNTIFDNTFSEYFGITEQELREMLSFYGISDKFEEMRQWYDGYVFGKTEIYNPWSVINYIDNKCVPMPYWVNTSGNALAGETLYKLGSKDASMLETLMDGGTIEKEVDTNITFPDIKRKKGLAFSLLAQTGYLKSIHNEIIRGKLVCTLKIPNTELETIFFDEIIERSMYDRDGELADDTKDLRNAILDGNVEKLNGILHKYLMNCGSHFDFTREKDYHNFMLGLFAAITGGYTRSNRESGEGRYDILLFPKPGGKFNLPGIIFELKHYKASPEIRKDKKKLDTMLLKHAKNALDQIEKKHYAAEFEQIGITEIIKYGVAFCGKKAKVIRYGE